VTERRALEQRLAQLERFEAVGHLAGGIAHDFNNLLTGILGHVALLREDDGIGTEAREDLDQIHDAAERAASLTRQLLAFGRRQVLSPRVLQLNRLVTGSLQAIRRTAGERIEVFHRLDPALDRVLADPGQVEGALLQLCARARDAMPAGGRLEITTAPVEVDAEAAARQPGLRPGAYATVGVRDSGPALEPEALAHIFDPFFRTEPTGPGANLGLASVYGVVKQSGGYIAVTSRPGDGTAFTLYFPRFAEGAEAGAGLPAREQIDGSETVILVEDEQQVRDLARRVLERVGYTVLAAADADSAVALADRHPGFIHLLITDMVLPRVSGRELAARLSIHRPAIKVLYISGTSDDSIARHRLLEPDTQFLEKPFGLDSLLHKVRQILAPVEGGRPTREILDRTP
jgi:nitrogen-specific signal transduction histidine kinase/CheY-like chemotaxis protein